MLTPPFHESANWSEIYYVCWKYEGQHHQTHISENVLILKKISVLQKKVILKKLSHWFFNAAFTMNFKHLLYSLLCFTKWSLNTQIKINQ